MTQHRLLNIHPPLINSSNPWASSYDDLLALYLCPHTGAVTTRTSLLAGFPDNAAIHQHTYFKVPSLDATQQPAPDKFAPSDKSSSLNTYGYSPYTLAQYLAWIIDIAKEGRKLGVGKPFILSVTGSPGEVCKCYQMISEAQKQSGIELYMEVNLSCPNIPGKSPSAYSASALIEYLEALMPSETTVPVGLKLPPYTYKEQFSTLIDTVRDVTLGPGGNPIVNFITATNTLGSCFVPDSKGSAALASADGSGIGGMAGAALHPLALGNVKMLSGMIEADPLLRGKVDIIGIGGVEDAHGYKRMKAAGASVVGIGTALGREGPAIFQKIATGARLDHRRPLH